MVLKRYFRFNRKDINSTNGFIYGVFTHLDEAIIYMYAGIFGFLGRDLIILCLQGRGTDDSFRKSRKPSCEVFSRGILEFLTGCFCLTGRRRR